MKEVCQIQVQREKFSYLLGFCAIPKDADVLSELQWHIGQYEPSMVPKRERLTLIFKPCWAIIQRKVITYCGTFHLYMCFQKVSLTKLLMASIREYTKLIKNSQVRLRNHIGLSSPRE